MQRKALDRIVSLIGLTLAVILLVVGLLATWAHNFIDDQIHTQLAAQQIFFPPKDSPALAGAQFAQMRKYAGQQLTTGAQAKTYADHFIAVHLSEIGGGKTYAQLSTQAQANPNDAKLADTVAVVFRGETLRGLLLNAYAFGTMATIAGVAAVVAYLGALVMLVLALLGFWHSRRIGQESEAETAATAEPVTA